MNSIRRPRRRPRVRSVSFRTFAWLLVREAYLRVWYPEQVEHAHTIVRRWVAMPATDRLVRASHRLFRREPDRRFFR